MVSINSSFDMAKNNNPLKKLPQSTDFKVEDISCLIDNLPVTVFRASSKLSWGMDYISINVENLTGYSKMDFIDQKLSWSDIVFPEDISIIDKAVQKAKKNKTSYQVEYRIKKSDGSTAFIQEHTHLICNEKGKLVYKDGIFSEVQQIKRKEDTHKAVKEDEEIQLEMFRSFVGKISAGEEIERISGDYTGETKKTVDLINSSVENIMGVLDEIMTISKAGKEGSLSIRSNNSKYPGGWGMLLREFNCALDAIITPLNVAAEYVERISRGDIPEHITDNYKGDFNRIKNNLNNCIDGLQGLAECNNVLQRMAVNDQTNGVKGEYVGIFASMGEATNQVRDHMLNVTKQLNHIAVGNTSKLEELKKIGKRSEQDNLLPAIIKAMEAIDLLIEDTRVLSKMAVEGKFDIRADVSKHRGWYKKIVQGFNDTLDAVVNPMNAAIEDSLMLSEAAVAGKLDIRADVTRHEGNFRKIISGFNDTLDAVIGPLNVAAEYVERISRGEIPEPITDDYRGDFNELKNNLNNCIEGLQGLVECDNVLQRMAVNDQTKGVEGKYVGIYASMGEATNEVRNRLLSVTKLVNDIAVGNTAQLTELKKVGKRSEQDRLLPAFIGAMENIDLLIEDAGMLSRAAVEGKLDTRADISKHRGEYRKIVEGVNNTLDAVIGPLNVAAEYVERISRGDIPEPIKDNYNGDFNEIKNDLNTCIEAINKLIEDSLMLSEAGVAGRYDTRADITSHEGDFRKIVSGFNDTLDAIVNPMNAAIEDSLMLSEAAVAGRLDIRADVTRHEGNFRKIISGFNDTLDAVIGPLNMAAEYVERISRGDVPQKITDSYNGDFNEIKNNLNACIDGLQGLVECNNVLQRMAVNDQTKGVEGEYVGIYASIGEATNNVRARVLNVTNVLNSIAVGDTSRLEELKKIGRRSEQDRLMPAIITAMENVNFLIEDTEMLSKAAVEGKLDVRADASKHQGEYRKVVEGINDTLDAVIGPLNVAAEYVERISRGDIPEHITENYNGDFNEIKNNLNACIDGLQGLVECNNVLQRMAVNDQTKGVEGEYVGIYASMGEATNNVRARVLNVTNQLNNIAVGDTSQLAGLKKIGQRSEQDRLMPAIIRAMENVNFLIEDTEILCNAAVEGKLDIRADASKHQGEYRKIVEGINNTLDAVIGPLNVAAEYVERIGLGEIPQKITDDYKGDFNEIKNNLNNCIDGLQGLVECNQILQRMAVNDQTKRVEGEYLGIYAAMGEATNKVRDRVLNVTNVLENIAIGNTSRLDELKKIGQRSEQDRLMPAIIRAMENVNLLIEDTEMLSKAAVEGKLDVRADALKHQGEYRKVVEGINDTLDAVIGPLNVAAEYVERISRGDIPEHITENYNGDFNEIKNNLNACIDGLQGLVECNNVLQRMAVNDQTKGVEGEYVGIYASMGEATNNVRARVLNVTNQLNNIAVGDTSQLAGLKKIGKRSEQDRLMPAIIRAMENVNFLIEDTEMLCKAAVEGKLDVRADASKHQGEYKKIVEGINDTLDAVIGPLNVAAEYVERISRGDIPEHIIDNYNGDFNEIKNNLNTCISAINSLIEDSLMLSEASVAGKLETRADATRHEGDFRKIIEGVNDTLDAVIGPLNDAIRVSNEFSNGNFRVRFDENLHVKGDFVNFKDVLNNIGISVSDIIKSAKSVTLNVVDCSNEASRGADDVANAAGNVAMSSQKSSELTRELLYKIEGINREIINLSASNEQIASTSKTILSSANEVVRIGKDAQALGKDTNLKMESVEKIAKESVDGISSLTEQIKQIDGIVQLINDITSQINLLSLNAAIEAARAGEHGRGFAVVAGEVKNLATKARNATETIENVVMSVQRDSKKTADAINIANSEIIDGVNSVNKTLDALNTIIKNATQVTQDIGDITKAIDNQVNISVKVVKASEEGNVMTQEVQKEAESLAAIAEETSASVQEIGAAIHEVTDLSNKLKSDMEVFTV